MVKGVVCSVQPYGVFVDMGAGRSGLLHLSQISDQHITADEVVKMFAKGDEIQASTPSFGRRGR